MNDLELLRKFQDGDDDAFGDIVRRHVGAVYSTARRVIQNPHLAQEVSQETFCLLARKARLLPADTLLIAWLHRAAWNIAMTTLRGEQRRRERERLASMTTSNSSDGPSFWNQIEPILDEGIEELNEQERKAILLKFFDGEKSRDIGLILGISEEAARARVSRAVEKLRRFLKKRGVSLTATSLAGLLMTNMEAVPATSLAPILTAVGLSIQAARLHSVATFLQWGLPVKVAGFLLTSVVISLTLFLTFQKQSGSRLSSNINDNQVVRKRLSTIRTRASNSLSSEAILESDKLGRVRALLYAPQNPDEIQHGLQLSQAIIRLGSLKHLALPMMWDAIRTNDSIVSHRAASGLAGFSEHADEIVPEIIRFMRTSTNVDLMGGIAVSGAFLKPSLAPLPEVIEAFRINPASFRGFYGWMVAYSFSGSGHNKDLAELLAPLLKSDNEQERFCSALVLGKTEMSKNPQVISILIAILDSGYRQGLPSWEMDAALETVRQIGPTASGSVEIIKKLIQRNPNQRLALEALASVSPQSRLEIPQLDAFLNSREAEVRYRKRSEKEDLSLTDWVQGLENSETRLRSIKNIFKIGKEAESVLPLLLEIFDKGVTDQHSDNADYMCEVGRLIHKLDPSKPDYFSSGDLRIHFTTLEFKLEAMEDKSSKALAKKIRERCFSYRPFTKGEVTTLLEEIKKQDATLPRVFMESLKGSPFVQLKSLFSLLHAEGYEGPNNEVAP